MHPKSELKQFGGLEISNQVQSVDELGFTHIEGRDPSGVQFSAHITDVVASVLQWEHSAANPTGD